MLVLLYLQVVGFDAESGSHALNKARHYVLVLLRHVRQINRMAFWKFLVLPKSEAKLGNIQDYHSELLMIARDSLRGGSASRADILAAMDTLHEAVVSMTAIFGAARVVGMDEPEESWAMDRYTCAALLPTLEERLRHFWLQLHGGVLESDSVR
jgi:hypothetical protein